jgi:hypothetical protein
MRWCRAWLIAAAACTSLFAAGPQARIEDLTHYSYVLGEERQFRIFLPPDYDRAAGKRYPVVYFFHGWSERYNRPPQEGQGYDSGDQYAGDNIAAFVATHDLIVVRWDGYNPRTPGEKYLRPYNISPVETYRQFPLYFPELVSYIDNHFRTIADREHRATAGLSMGGFMSYWIAGKYPHLVGSASSFMGSSEFFVGPNEFPVEYRHADLYRNYEGIRTRIVLGSKDFIRWYHRRMNAIWDYTRAAHEHEQFEWDHGTPGMARTLAFHMRAFENPLPRPALWHHADVYPSFDVWGYSVASDRDRPGFTLLENASRGGFRSSVREWLPEGRLMPAVTLRIATAGSYRAGIAYRITDMDLDTGAVQRGVQKADESGRLHFLLNGARHEVGIVETARPVLAVADWQVSSGPWAVAGKPVRLKIGILNKGAAAASAISTDVFSRNPGVEIRQRHSAIPALGPGRRAGAPGEVVFIVHDPHREIVQFQVRLRAAQGEPVEIPIEVPVFRDAPPLAGSEVADGAALPLWEHAVERAKKVLGSGNGDGTANPGETIAIVVRDGDAFRTAELFTTDACVDLTQRVSDPWGNYDHVGATAKFSLAVISATCPEGHEIPLFARLQFPNKPDHKLTEGVVRVRVTGRDRTPPRVVGARMRGGNLLEVEIRDGGRVKSAVAILRSGDAEIRAALRDDGAGADAAAGDGVLTAVLPPPAAGNYRLTVSAEDESGNAATVPAGEFRFAVSAVAGKYY